MTLSGPGMLLSFPPQNIQGNPTLSALCCHITQSQQPGEKRNRQRWNANGARVGVMRDKCHVMYGAVATQHSGFTSSNGHCGAVTSSSTLVALQADEDMKPSNKM